MLFEYDILITKEVITALYFEALLLHINTIQCFTE